MTQPNFAKAYKLGLVAITSLCTIVAFGESPRDDWNSIKNRDFSFSIPKALKKTDARGVDSFVEEYVGDGIELSFDYGAWSNDFHDWPKETVYENVKVGEETARLGTAETSFGYSVAKFCTQIYFKDGHGHARLDMFAACRSKAEVEVAKKIFKTIRFTKR